MSPLQAAELHPGHGQRTVERARRVAIHGDGLVVGELPARPLALAVAVPRGRLRGAGRPREAAVAGAAREQGDLKGRREVERLTDEVGGAAVRRKAHRRVARDIEAARAWHGGGVRELGEGGDENVGQGGGPRLAAVEGHVVAAAVVY